MASSKQWSLSIYTGYPKLYHDRKWKMTSSLSHLEGLHHLLSNQLQSKRHCFQQWSRKLFQEWLHVRKKIILLISSKIIIQQSSSTTLTGGWNYFSCMRWDISFSNSEQRRKPFSLQRFNKSTLTRSRITYSTNTLVIFCWPEGGIYP